jgi:nicotinamidase-related amidase
MVKTALLIIDVQKSAVGDSPLPAKIEALQAVYEHIFVSRFVNRNSPLIPMTGFDGYADEALAFTPAPRAVVFEKNVYSSFIPVLKGFDEVHLCGFDTDACVYKTALDLIENSIRPVVLAAYCGSENRAFHEAGILLLERNIGRENILREDI